MWTSRGPSESKCFPSTQPEDILWSDALPLNHCPVITTDHGNLESEISQSSKATRIAQFPLHHAEDTKPYAKRQNAELDGKKPCSTVFVNHQGHTVKMARLTDPPSLVSFPVKGPSLHDDMRASVKRSVRKNVAITKRHNESSSSQLEADKVKEDSMNVNYSGKSVQHTHVSSTRKYNEDSVISGSIKRRSVSSTLMSSSAKAQIAFKASGSTNTNPKIAKDCSDGKVVSTIRQPSDIKEELQNGLKKITADLVALRVLDCSDSLTKVPSEKGDHKRPLPTEHTTEDLEESKENNSPFKRSKGSHFDPSKCAIAEKQAFSRTSLSGSHGNVRLFQSHDPTLQSTNITNRKKSSLTDCRAPLPHGKSKSYDPEKAREYIRQQKKERVSRLKAERERKKAEMDARQQKLNELSRTTSKLVKASIKPKSNASSCSFTEKVHEDDDKGVPVPSKFDFIDDCCPSNAFRKRTSNHSAADSTKCPSDVQSTVVDLSASPDLSNSQLIREISDMKSQIEAMAKTLKSTFVNNRGKRPVVYPKTEKKPMSTSLKDVKGRVEAGPTLILESESAPVNGRRTVVENDINVEDVMQSNISPAYLHNLTSNLRKMRESLQNVLSQSEVRYSGSSAEHQSLQNVKKGLSKHRRFSSAGSESAFESLLYDASKDTQVNGEKSKITTSFPTLPVADVNALPSERAQHLRATSEADISGKMSDLSGMTRFQLQNEMHSNMSAQIFSQQTDLDKPHLKEEKSHPVWLEKFGRPYPITIMSAVKRKFIGAVTDDILDDRSHPDLSKDPQACDKSLIGAKPDLSSFEAHRGTVLLGTGTPRADPTLEKEVTSTSSTAPDLIAPSIVFDPAVRRESFPQPNFWRGYEEREKANFRPISPVPCSILEALNLEKMNADFENALNFGSNTYDVMPAEKPLSAPNTPAKSASKVTAGKSEQSHSGSTEMQAKLMDSESNKDLKTQDQKAPSTAPHETTPLVPPNINLLSGRLDKKSLSVDSLASYSQKSNQKLSSCDDQSEKTSQSDHLKTSSSRNTFEIGQVFNPSALHLQFQAELNILDSFNESLCQVMEIEKVRAVSLARHQAIQENLVMKEDKAIDVQKSLIKSGPEISSINYTRGSSNLSEVTMLDTGSSSLGLIDSEQVMDDNHTSSIREDCPSTHSSAASEIHSAVEKPLMDVGQSLSEGPVLLEQPSPSTEKGISEDIHSTSDDLSETPGNCVDKGDSLGAASRAGTNISAHNGIVQSNSTEKSNKRKKAQESFSLDVTVNSYNADSSVAGNEALLIESLSRSECHIFPSFTTGEDMFEFTLQMLEQLMHEEELRVQHKNTLLKLRVKVLGEMARAEVASLNLDKKKLREKGEDGHKDQITALRKKQRGIMLRFQQQREEIERLRRTEELAWQERRLMYLQQMHLIRMQVSTRVMLRKFEKNGGTIPKKSRVVFRSIRESRSSKSSQKGASGEIIAGPPEGATVGVSLTHSSSVSLASLVSDASPSSILSNSSRRPGGAGDSESSHLEDRVLKGLSELEKRCRDLKDREKSLHEKRQSVEQIIQWRRKLEEEEHRLKDVERQAHGRHRSSFTKHALRDRSTSPFQFPDSGASGVSGNGSGMSTARSVSDLVRTGRNNGNMGGSGSQSFNASITEEVDSSVPEEISENNSKPSVDSTPNATNTDQYANESFESEVSEIKTAESKSGPVDTQHSSLQKEQTHASKSESECDLRLPRMSERSNKYPGVTIKVPLSPRLQRVQRRRYSSGSDDSMVLSQTETGSEQSDIEGRISALTEQLQQCKAEAERLRREAKRTRNERLIAKEQSLQKQLQAYETYICQLRNNLDAELKQSSVPIVRPQIKQPRVAPGKVASRRQDSSPTTASVSQATSPDATSVRKDDSEFEAVAIASEAASEATSEAPSEAASEVPSDVASEVSENSSLISNDAPSFVANKAITKEMLPVSNEEERTMEALSDASETCSEMLSGNGTDNLEEPSSAHFIFKEIDELNEKSKSETLAEEPNLVSDGVFHANEEIAETTEPVRSLTSEEEPEDVSELLEDDHEVMVESEGGSSSEVIKVFLREKEKDSVHEMPGVQVDVMTRREELVDQITNEILEGLMKECLQPAAHSHSTTPSHKQCPPTDAVWDSFIKESLSEATDDILSIYKRKRFTTPVKSETHSGNSRSHDVRQRVSEILAEAQSPGVLRAKGRVREMMVTTYGVLSPDDSPCGSPNQASSPIQQLRPFSPNEHNDSSPSKGIDTTVQSPKAETAFKASKTQMGLIGVSVVNSEGISQEWFDEDFGLTHSKREAEELRRQQLQIEQEIEQLQQQQAQAQEQIPYYFVREIPNKPPPPYTPPGQAPRLLSSSSSLSPPVEEVRAVCSDRTTILKCIAAAVDLLYNLREEGKDIIDWEAPISYVEAGFDLAVPSHLSEQELAIYKNSARVYKIFLFDLAKQLVLSAYSCEQEDPTPPWLRPENSVRRRKALAVVPKTREMLHEFVSKQVLVLFGFVPKASKENLTIRWSRKKRDHVDELLVRESQEEERQWTNYEQDEAVVKNNVTIAILDSLLDDTVRVLSDILRKKMERHCSENMSNECSVY